MRKDFQVTAAAAIAAIALFSSTVTAFVVSPRLPLLVVEPHQPWSRRAWEPFTTATTTASVPSSSSTQLWAAPIPTGSSDLWKLFWETVIINGVPTAFTLLTLGVGAFFVAAARSRGNQNKMDDFSPFSRDNPVSALYTDIYGDQDNTESQQGKSPLSILFRGRNNPVNAMMMKTNANVGIPKDQFLRLTHLNRQYESYQYSMVAATQGKAKAAAQFRQASFQRALRTAVTQSLTPSQASRLQQTEAEFLKQGRILTSQLYEAQTKFTQQLVDGHVRALWPAEEKNSAAKSSNSGLEKTNQLYPLDPPEQNVTIDVNATNTSTSAQSSAGTQKKTPSIDRKLSGTIQGLQKNIQELESDFIEDILEIVGPQSAAAVRTALLGNVATRGSGSLLLDLQDRPLTQLLNQDGATTDVTHANKNAYVIRFPGDTTASQVANLREEVTALLQTTRPGVDEVIVVLQTGGGTVTGYGLAAGQLLRFKQKGLKLTIAVEQVAASGGYMMCCVADRIVASPFAVLGSIGVISDIPNVYERLRREGIEFQTVTAGKFKRTLTPTKKVTKEDFEKSKQDVEEILVLFRDFVKQNRPQLNMEEVATGETWFGTSAMEKKLCDQIMAVDDLISEFVQGGYGVYELEYVPPLETPFGRISPASAETAGSLAGGDGVVSKCIRWLVQTVAKEIRSEIGSSSGLGENPITRRYMAEYDNADRMRSD